MKCVPLKIINKFKKKSPKLWAQQQMWDDCSRDVEFHTNEIIHSYHLVVLRRWTTQETTMKAVNEILFFSNLFLTMSRCFFWYCDRKLWLKMVVSIAYGYKDVSHQEYSKVAPGCSFKKNKTVLLEQLDTTYPIRIEYSHLIAVQ